MFDFVHHVAYVVSDMEDALRIFRDIFDLELSDRRVIEGETSVEMAAFRCGPSLIEILRPINHPALAQFLEEHGPGLHHIGFAMRDLTQGVDALREKGITINGPFVAGTGWKIAYFNFEESHLDLLKSCYHGDHLAEAENREARPVMSPIYPPQHFADNEIDQRRTPMTNIVETSTPANTPNPIGPYNHIAKVGQFISIGGTAGVNPATDQLAGTDVYSQAKQILVSFQIMLQSVGSNLAHIIHVNVFLKDMQDFEEMNRAYIEMMGDHRPARTVIGVSELPKPGVLLTMNLTAVTKE